jgi:hypothetical protein
MSPWPACWNLTIPLSRIIILGLLVSVPGFFHHWINEYQGDLALPGWAWALSGVAIVYLLSHGSVPRLGDHAAFSCGQRMGSNG